MSNITANPPVDSINGAWFVNGTIIYGTNGFRLISPPGLYTFDPKTNISKPLLNNYRGLRFATPDDIVVDHRGNILFTDAPFGYVCHLPNITDPRLAILFHTRQRCHRESGYSTPRMAF